MDTLDPRLLGPAQWALVNVSMRSLAFFVVLAINTAVCFLVAHALIPSLITTGDAPGDLHRLRRVLYPLAAASLVAAIFAFVQALSYGVALIQQIYPRFAI